MPSWRAAGFGPGVALLTASSLRQIPASAMARPLQDGSLRAEPTAAVSGSPAGPLGGTLALPTALRPGTPAARLSTAPRRTPLGSGSSGTLLPVTTTPQGLQEEEGVAAEPEQRAAEPNGHVPRHLPTLEREIGARLREMGDRFQLEYEQREHRPRGAAWGHFYHFVFHLLGVLYNLPVRG
ncbi:uncharacterized protein [Anolis sagrei]|uniref:uncharacterized protein isoform X1 n=2 Tax=Anolis sagrei TaxID=38937 RepID=UPI0035229414